MDQAQGLTLVDGEWVSRPLDPYHAMAHAQHNDTEMRDIVAKPILRVPEYGLLSRTVITTPLVRLTLPANIRHKDLTDVVLIGEDSVQLKELRDYGHIRHVATKTDFKGGRIIAAKVFGDPREVPKTSGVASPLPKRQLLQRGRSMTGDEEHILPPEVVVLTLSSRTLMFLWARHTQNGVATFNQRTIRLPAGSSRFDRLGTFLAIDPKRRAIAVAADEGRFVLYKTKPMEKWRNEIRGGSETSTPIEDERIISIQGRIMHMDFLSSGGASDDFHVVLLFIAVHEGKTKLTCFDWDCRQDLSKATARVERIQMQREDFMPSLLIPLRRSPDFLLVFDTHISVYKDVLSGLPKRTVVPIDSNILAPLRPGDSKRRPQWTAWDKTPRNPEFPKEVFYIAREDGRIMYAAQGSAGSVEMDEAGEWPYRIDTAFACLSVDNSESSQLYPDVLIAGGAGNDGLLCKVGSWPTEYPYAVQYPNTNQFSYVESMPNWTPLTDLSVTKLSTPRAPEERQRSAIFVSNGSSPHGEISELRHGIQALVDDSFSGINGCAGIWVVDYGSHMVEIEGTMKRQHYAVFTITLPPETLVIRVVRTQPESRADFSGAWEHGSWDKFQTPADEVDDSLMRDEETISACSWSDELSVQITRQEARSLRRPLLRQIDSLVFNNSLLLAASRTGYPFIAVTFREAGHTHMEIIRILRGGVFDKTNTQRHQLAFDPTCIEILDIEGSPHVFVSTFDSKMMIYRVDDKGGSSLVMEDSWGLGEPDRRNMLCESAVLLKSKKQCLLVCAMRDGSLLSSPLEMGDAGASHLSWTSIRMGATPAKIVRSETDMSSAFVSCGADFCRVRCAVNDSSSLEIDSVWFTNRIQPGYVQSPVSAMYQLPFLPKLDAYGRNIGGFLFAVSGDQLLFSQLDSDVKWPSHDASFPASYDSRTVPRKLLTGARPTKILYMKRLRRVLVSTMEAKEERPPPNGYRVLHSTIKLLRIRDDKPIDEADIKQEDGALVDRLVVAQYSLLHAERAYSMIEWPYTNPDGKKYSLVIVGTGVRTDLYKSSGRKLIFTTGKTGTKLELQKQSTFEEPVYSIALWNNEHTVSVSGKTLSIECFDSQEGRFKPRGQKELPSAGIHITASPPYVYVSTLQHSHLCYEVRDAATGKLTFEQVFSDSRQRDCAHHLVVDIPHRDSNEPPNRFVILTDKKSASISALYQPPELTYKSASNTLFEACLPRAVIRLDRGDIRPPWRRPTSSGMVNGVLVDDIIGACTDGSIYSFSILEQPARHLLRLIQNLIQVKATRSPTHQHSVVKERSGDIFNVLMNGAEGNQDGDIRVKDVDPRYRERDFAGAPRQKAIDGDLLGTWMDEGGNLRELVGEDTDREVGKLFVELAGGINAEWVSADVVEGAMRWLREILMPVL